MTRLHLPRLDLHLAGLDPALVQEALGMLPGALEHALDRARASRARGASESMPEERSGTGPAELLSSSPSAAQLAQHIAGRVAARVSATEAGRPPSGSAAAPEVTP